MNRDKSLSHSLSLSIYIDSDKHVQDSHLQNRKSPKNIPYYSYLISTLWILSSHYPYSLNKLNNAISNTRPGTNQTNTYSFTLIPSEVLEIP